MTFCNRKEISASRLRVLDVVYDLRFRQRSARMVFAKAMVNPKLSSGTGQSPYCVIDSTGPSWFVSSHVLSAPSTLLTTGSEAYYPYAGFPMYDLCSPLDSPDWDHTTGFCQVPALDSSSDCSSTDSQESGFGSYSSPGSFSLRGSSVSTMDPSTLSQITDEIPFYLDASVYAQDCQPLDPGAWRHSTHGSVEPGFSPTESYSCQSSAMNLSSVAQQEPYVYQLPGPYLPHESKVHGSIACASPEVSPHTIPELGFQYRQAQFGFPTGYRPIDMKISTGTMPAYSFLNGLAPYSGSYATFSSAPAPSMRPLLPRTEATESASQPTYGSQRVLKPQVPGAHRPSVSSRVSSFAGLPQEGVINAMSPVSTAAPASYGMTGASATSVDCVSDPVEQEFNAFIHLDQDDQAIHEYATYGTQKQRSARVGNVMHGYQVLAAEQIRTPSTIEPSPYNVEQDACKSVDPVPEKITKAMSSASGSLTGDNDEGRHRTHPLYSNPPDEDGLYRCPFKSKEKCPHKETKLKCNYEYEKLPLVHHLPHPGTDHRSTHSKYIDSHLKPFRCKVEACAQQEFSSTACLLRHEREAHGMHGHGERPHLCLYKGCERGVHGNGFPRRYNLFDHMKRVHDHREDLADATVSPYLGAETQKKAKGAKRKASGSPVAGQPAQKALAIDQHPVMAIPIAHEAYYYPAYY